MEQLKSRKDLEDEENVQIEWPKTWWEMFRSTHTTAKELQKKVAGTGIAVHRTKCNVPWTAKVSDILWQSF